MKSLLCGTAIALLISSSALAGSTIPKAFQGDWCPRKVRDQTSEVGNLYVRGKCPPSQNEDQTITIQANGYEEWESSCKVRRVTKKPAQILNVDLRCWSQGEKIHSKIELYFFNEIKEVLSVRTLNN